jgi:hypothetical protein
MSDIRYLRDGRHPYDRDQILSITERGVEL